MNRFDRINQAVMFTSIALIGGLILQELIDMHAQLFDLRRVVIKRSADALVAQGIPGAAPSSKATAHAEVP